MTARILLVDDVEMNRKLLAARLERDYYLVSEAASGQEAIDRAQADPPDVILLDVMMPGMDGYEVCKRLKEDPRTRHVPVVMVSSLDARGDRVRGLEAGADDFLTKPVDTLQLVARVRCLTRHKAVMDELRSREAAARRLGALPEAPARSSGLAGVVRVIEDATRERDWIAKALDGAHRVAFWPGEGAAPAPDVVLVSLTAETFDGLALIARLRADPLTAAAPILAIAEPESPERALRALDLGAQDLIYRPIDAGELRARVRTAVARKRDLEALRVSLDQGMQLAVTDQLTGLNNRRYLMGQLEALVRRAGQGGAPVSVVLMDIDHFKAINDANGHDVGDEVLKEFARRLSGSFRAVDLAARFGGEEFLVALPGARADFACLIGERFRRAVAGAPFPVRGGAETMRVTVSLGVASAEPGDTVDRLLKRADEALYRAKSLGRNRVTAAAA